MLLEILWIWIKNRGFNNIKTYTNTIITFSNRRTFKKVGDVYTIKNTRDKNNVVTTSVDMNDPLTPDNVKVIKQFLYDEFRLDG